MHPEKITSSVKWKRKKGNDKKIDKAYILPGKAPAIKLRLKKVAEKPWENKSANEKYILCYCSYFAAVLRILEGIRNLAQQALTERVPWMKNTSSPQYFDWKSGLRPESLILVAFVVFLKNLEGMAIKWCLSSSP